jgi:uncharacterized membrane protein YphA (DoxX/SURF4 family)
MEEQTLPEGQEPAPEEKHVISDYFDGVKQLEMETHESGIKKARNSLFVVGALAFIGEMISLSGVPDGYNAITVGVALLIAGIFVALGFWTKTKPFTAIITGLIVLVLYWGLAIFADPQNIYRGVLVRVVIIVYLAKGLKDAKAWEDLKKQG